MNIPTFDEATHTYYSESGKILPSVTQILAPLDAADLAALNPSVLKAASTRGTIVHDLCAQLDYGVDLADLEIIPELAGYLQAYKNFLRDYSPEWEMIEQPLYLDRIYTPFAGTLDRYGKIDGKPVLVDIKTTSSIGHTAKVKYITQLVAYEHLLSANGVETYRQVGGDCEFIEKYILQLKADGTYRFVNVFNEWTKDLTFADSDYDFHHFNAEGNEYDFANPSVLFYILTDLYYLMHKEK